MRQRLFEPLGMDPRGSDRRGTPVESTSRGAITLSGKEIRPTQQDNAPAYGTRRHRALHRARLGQVCRAYTCGDAQGKALAVETGHFPGPAYSSAG